MRLLIAAVLVCQLLYAQPLTYDLHPVKISDNSYYLLGKTEYFSKENGANISNCAFIVTPKSVIVIDSGSTLLYGKELIAEIKKITPLPISYLLNTHHHPDHFLGNKAFENVTILATQYTRDEIAMNGDAYIVNLTNLSFDWMKGTQVKVPDTVIGTESNDSKTVQLDGYTLELFFLDGHTQSDLAVYDAHSRTLYASDLVFYNRTPATPHANLPRWIATLQDLRSIDYAYIVPGHGQVSKSKEPIDQTLRYLHFLDTLFTQSAVEGLNIYEVLKTPVSKAISEMPMFAEEFERSVINLYPEYELKQAR